MTIYKLRYRFKSYLSINITNEEMWAKLGKPLYPRGESVSSIWQPMSASFINTFDETANGKQPDIADWETNMVFGPKAYDALASMLLPFGEFLPLSIEGEVWYVFNATTIYNTVDDSASQQHIMDGVIMGVDELLFDESKLGPAPVFRTDFDDRMSVYCNQAFKDAVQAQGFEAVLFREDLTAPM
ncbi:hypothetical protein R50072_08020 [Simiduia litorea]|uniref:imm11 family protein n=1 Tax=Simiduia litorea TaxID=1435348 RepID=UPI0036F3ACE4